VADLSAPAVHLADDPGPDYPAIWAADLAGLVAGLVADLAAVLAAVLADGGFYCGDDDGCCYFGRHR